MSKNIVEETFVDEPMTEEDKKNEVALNENELLKMLTAKDDAHDETQIIEVKRGGGIFRFRIRALTEREWDNCREKATKYMKNRRLGGMKMPDKTDTVYYHSLLIYTATIKEDREKLWDNKALWNAINAVTGTDVVDAMIPFAGKKQAIIDQIERLSGYGEDDENEYNETVKN